MKKNASLALIEQAVMLLVLAIAAALCLKAFVWADTQSLHYSNRDRAITQLQSAAEVLKFHKGDLTAAAQTHGGSLGGGQWVVALDKDWNQTAAPGDYRICATLLDCDTDYLGGATLTVLPARGEPLAQLTVYWQEATP